MNSNKKILTKFFFIYLFVFCRVLIAQSNSENSNPIIVIPNNEEKPSLFNPKKKENTFLQNDYLTNPLDISDPKLNIENNEEFINPGDRYKKKLNGDQEKNKNPNKFKVDQYLGDFRNNGKFVQIAVRDHESPDGDLIKIMLNDVEVVSRILLQERFKAISLDLIVGFNKIDFVALNQGRSGPNTAEVRVFDDKGGLIGSNRWNLATGVKATYIIVKEK
jgi:hypothetical protein